MQIKKNLSAIANELMVFDTLSNVKNIPECNTESLKRRFEEAKETCSAPGTLFKTLESDPVFNVNKVIKDFKTNILKSYAPYETKQTPPEVSCQIPDSIATQVAYTAHMQTFKAVMEKYTFNNKTPIAEQIRYHISEDRDENLAEKFQFINRMPLIRDLITNSENNAKILSHTPIETLLSSNNDIIEKSKNDLIRKCKNSYKEAVKLLCGNKSSNTLQLDYKKLRSETKNKYLETKSPSKEFQTAQTLHYYCKSATDEKTIDLSKEIEKVNNSLELQGNLKNLTPEKFISHNYENTQQDVRKSICNLIPGNGDLLANLKNCEIQQQNDSKTCLYLKAYKELVDKKYSEKLLADNSNKTKKLEVSNTETMSEDLKAKSSINYNWKDVAQSFEQPSSLITNFLATTPQETNKIIQKQIVKVKNQPNFNSNNSQQNNNFTKKIKTDLTSANFTSNKAKKTSPNKKGIKPQSYSSGNSQNKFDNSYSNSNLSEPSSNSKTDHSFMRRMFKKKKGEGITHNDTVQPQDIKNFSLNKKNKKKSANLEHQIEKDFSTFSSGSSNKNIINDMDDEEINEMVADEIAFDSNFGSNSRRPANIRNNTAGIRKTSGPGYFKNSMTGEIVKTPTLAMDTIPNSGFAGTGINTGNNNLNELTQITLYGTLADDLSLIDPDTVEVLDSNSSKLALQINTLVQKKEPFVLKNQYQDNQKILVKFNEFGGYNLFVKDQNTGKYRPATETSFNDSEYEAFYKNVQKAFNQNFIAKFTK